ncbi:MAG: dipeptide epimerase, partial [Planctomycetota bacterium]
GVSARLPAGAIDDPAEVYDQLLPDLREHSFAHCALNQALHDLWGKQQGKPVYQLWGLDTSACPVSNFTIGIDRVEKMVEKLREVPDWPIYKVKLGGPDDLEVIRRLREHTDAPFRVDANCGWTVDEAIEKSQTLAELGVEFIEQPLKADAWDDLKRVFHESALPIMADESCITFPDVERCHGHFHGINIKLTKCGGLTPAKRMIERARELNLKVMIGCMTESSVGISAIAQLLPLLDFVDMDGACLLSADVAQGVRVVRGVCHYPEVAGNGVTLLEGSP